MREPPQDLVAFIDEHMKKGSSISVKRFLGRNKYRLISEAESAQHGNPDELAASLFRSMLNNLQNAKLPKAKYKVTTSTKVGRRLKRSEWSKHFEVSLTPEEIAPEIRCDDCKGEGWYVGIIERKPCPTCGGSGMR